MAISIASYIEIDERGTAWITGANTRVIEVVLDKLAYGWSPEETHFQHPHLSLAQIYSALAYYYENKANLDEEIEGEQQEAAQLASRLSRPALRRQLLERKQSR